MKKQIKQIFNPLSGSFDSIQTSDATKDASQLMLLTADEAITDWNNFGGGFSISKVDPLFGDASYVLEMTNLKAATYKVIPVDIGFRGTTVALTFNYLMLDGAARVELLDQDNNLIDGTQFDIPAANGKEKFGVQVFIPSSVTGIRFKAETRATVVGGSFKFDNVQLSSDLLKSVDINNLVQSDVLLNVGNVTQTTDLSTFTSQNPVGAGLYTLGPSGISILQDCDIIVAHCDTSITAGARATYVYVNGTSMSKGGGGQASGSMAHFTGRVKANDKITFLGVNNAASTNIQILATARTKSIVAPTDQVTERSIAFRWRSPAEATEANLSATGQIGDYVTGQYAINTNNLTQCTTRPTQTDADMSLNGPRIYTRAYNAASTAALPARFVIKIAEPNQMASCDVNIFKDTTRKIIGGITGNYESTANLSGLLINNFNPDTGLLCLDSGWVSSNITQHYILFSDISIQTNGYICFTASKLAQAVAIPKTNPVAIIKDVKPSGTTGGTSVALAWQTRTLNTLEDPYGIVSSLVSNRFTLGKGKYLIEASAPSHSTNNHKIVLKEMPSSATKIVGDQGYSNSSYQGFSFSSLRGFVGISTDTSYEINHYTMGAITSTGLGTAASTGEPEVYTQVTITKLD